MYIIKPAHYTNAEAEHKSVLHTLKFFEAPIPNSTKFSPKT